MAARKTINQSVVSAVRRYIDHIRSKGIPIHRAYVFGSWAKGLADSASDIDVCIVSPAFKNEIEDLQFLLRETRTIDDRIEPLPLSLVDFSDENNPLVAEIKRYGYPLMIKL